MLRQLLTLGGSLWLAKFTVAVHNEAAFSASDVKKDVIRSLLGAAIVKASFYRPVKEAPRPTYHYYNQPPKPAPTDYFARVKSFVGIAQRVGCDHMVDTIIGKVIDIEGLSAHEARDCSQKVMLPLAAYFAKCNRSESPVPLPSRFSHL